MLFVFTSDKQNACGEQKMVLAAPFDFSVNFTDQKFCRLKLWKSGKMPKFLMYYFIPLKNYWRQVETWHNYSYIVGQ